MIKAKHGGQYKQVGFIKVRQPDGTYKDVEKKYGKTIGGGYSLVFEKGFTREAEGELPLTLNGIGKPLKDYDIEGNIYQSDGASPDTPQEVKGSGDRTGNLWDEEWEIGSVNSETGGNLNISSGIRAKNYTPIKPNTQYVMSVTGNSYTVGIQGRFYDKDKNYIGYSPSNASGVLPNVPFTTPDNAYYFRFSMQAVYGTEYKNDIMLNSGSTPLPYEPYGYKIPVECRGKNLLPDIWGHTGIGLDNGNIHAYATRLFSEKISVKPSSEYAIAINGTSSEGERIYINRIIEYSSNDEYIRRVSLPNQDLSYLYLASDDCYYIVIDLRTSALTTEISGDDLSECQLETGSTATEYEPYTPPVTTNIYLDSPLYKIGDYADSRGMTEEVRAIKELVLTGEENWAYITGGKHWMPVTMYQKSGLTCICSHYEAVANGSGSSLVANGQVGFYSSAADRLIFCNTNYTTTEDWKSYLAAQYAAGTPVKVYYVLATPETKVVSPVEIPTLNGTTVIDVDTEIKPSKMWVKYKSSK